MATQPCTGGYTNLTADFAYPSEVPGYIWLESENLDLVALEPSINERVSCASDYRLSSRKAVEYRDSYFPNTVIWVPVATKGILVKVEYFTRYTDDFLTKTLHGYDPLIASPSVETVLKVWDAPNIESLYGTRVFTCDNPGDSRVDSIDEIASRRKNLLTAAEQAGFDPYTDVERNNLAWTDGNGDGSICDRYETDPEGDGESITRITLAVYPAKG